MLPGSHHFSAFITIEQLFLSLFLCHGGQAGLIIVIPHEVLIKTIIKFFIRARTSVVT